MMSHRALNAALGVTVLLLLLANAAWYAHRQRSRSDPASRPVTAWDRWRALTPDERAGYVQQYQKLFRGGDAGELFRRARRFVAQPAVRRQAQRETFAILVETITRQPPAVRNEWLRMPPTTRAFFVYRALSQEEPERLEAQRARWAAG